MIERREGKEIIKIDKKESETLRFFVCCFWAFIGVVLYGCSTWTISLVVKIAYIIIGTWILIYTYKLYSSYNAKYKIDERGIIAKYPFHSVKLIPWSEFQQVCVCYGDYSKANSAFVYICCVKKDEKKNFYGRWKTNSAFHYRTVITMDYTEQLYDEIKEKCPYEVLDLRNTRAYRL